MSLFTPPRRTIISYLSPLLAVVISLAGGSVFILLAGASPLEGYSNLFRAGFGCAGPGARCALLTALQFSVPLLLSGLSAMVALRAGFFSIGQAGQMLFGAAAACWIGARAGLPAGVHPLAALAGGALAGAVWSGFPAVLKERLGVNEIVLTLILNPIAGFLVGLVRLPRISPTARLQPLIHGTRLSAGLFVALGAVLLIYLYLWRFAGGYEVRMTGQNPRFALFGGIAPGRSLVRGVMISGALAGLAGAVEVLGVHYRFVTSFSAVSNFDGLIVAFAGQLHPLGVLVFAILLGGLRAGALTGLQIQSGIPRELGGALIAMILMFIATDRLFRGVAGSSRLRPVSGMQAAPGGPPQS